MIIWIAIKIDKIILSEFAVDKDGSNRCYKMVRIDSALIFNDLRGRGARIASALKVNDLAMSRKSPLRRVGLESLLVLVFDAARQVLNTVD